MKHAQIIRAMKQWARKQSIDLKGPGYDEALSQVTANAVVRGKNSKGEKGKGSVCSRPIKGSTLATIKRQAGG